MSSPMEDAILCHIHEQSPTSLRRLYESLLAGNLIVPLASELTTDANGRTDVPVICIRLPDGEGCLPAFTSITQFLEWKGVGTPYTSLPVSQLFNMAMGMPEIDCIYVNYSGQQGTPKGKVTRAEFQLLAKGIFPEN